MIHKLARWCFALALVGLVTEFADAQPRNLAPRLSEAAPEFSLQDVNGETVNFADYKGSKNLLVVVDRGWIGYW